MSVAKKKNFESQGTKFGSKNKSDTPLDKCVYTAQELQQMQDYIEYYTLNEEELLKYIEEEDSKEEQEARAIRVYHQFIVCIYSLPWDVVETILTRTTEGLNDEIRKIWKEGHAMWRKYNTFQTIRTEIIVPIKG